MMDGIETAKARAPSGEDEGASRPPPDRPSSNALFGALGFFAVSGFCGVAFSPYLLVHHPLVLIALNPIFRHLVLAAPSIDPVPFFVVGLVRLFLPDPVMYELGRRFGPRTLTWIEARSVFAGQMVRWIERMFNKAWLLVLFVNPTLTVSALAGAAKIPFGRFVAVNLLGTATMLVLVRLLGEAFAAPIQTVLAFVAQHVRSLTLASLGIALVSWLFYRRGARVRYERMERERRGAA